MGITASNNPNACQSCGCDDQTPGQPLFLGNYASLDVLNTSQPNPDPGSYAYITIPGQADDMAVWDNGDNTWRNIGQNNIGKTLLFFLQPGTSFNINTGVQLLNNGGPFSSMTSVSFPIEISEKESPVLFTFGETIDGTTKKYIYVFIGGKKSWAKYGTPVDASQFTLIDIQGLTVDDIPTDFTTELGEIPEDGFIGAMNSEERNLMDNTRPYYFSYYTGNELYYALFKGDPGIYGGGSVFQFNEDQFAIVTDGSASEVITRTDQLENTGEGSSPFTTVASLNGLTLESNQAAAEIYLKNAEGEILSTINVAFLNNEGTTFFYNESTEKLELKNDAGEILSEVPVGAFVANLMQSVNFNGASPFIFEFKDAQGNVVDSVSFSISNIQGLQAALDGKISTSHPANGITSPLISKWNNMVSSDYTQPVNAIGYVNGASLNDLPTGTYATVLSTTATDKPFASVGGLMSIGATGVGQGTQILGSRTGNELWFRPYSNTYGSWYRLWNSGDFTLTGDLSSNEDLNNYINTGIYTQDSNSDAAGGTNYPTPYAGILKVFRKGDFVWQVYHSYSVRNEIFFRGRNSGSMTWGSWQKSWDDSDFTQTNIDNWNSVYADKSNYLRNQADGTVGSYLGGTSISNLNDLITGMVWTSGSVLNLPSGVSYLVLSLSGSEGYSAQLAMRNTNFFFRAQENGVWGSWKRLWHASDFTQSNINNWNNALLKSGGTMTGAIKYGSPTANQTSFIGTQLAGTEIGYTAWVLQNLDYDSVNNKFTKPRGNLLSHALALGTGDKALRLMYAPNVGSNGDDADLSTVFSVDSLGRIITLSHGTSEQWNEAYNRGDFRDFGLGVNAVVSNDWDSINQTGFYYNSSASATGLPLAVSSISLQHIEQGENASQFAIRTVSNDTWIRRRTPSGWSAWVVVWTSDNITQTEINNWQTAYGHTQILGNPHNTQIADISGLQTAINKIPITLEQTFAVDFSPIAAGAVGIALATMNGVEAGDFVEISYTENINANFFFYARATGEDQITIHCRNFSSTSADLPAFDMRIKVTK